jgi:hypothetical protein
MATARSQFKIKQWEGFGGNFVDSQYLAASYDTAKPYVFENTLAKIFTSSDRFTGKPLLGMTAAKGNIKEIDNEVYRWYLQGAEEKCARVIENLEINNPTAGIGRTTFRVKLDLDYFMSPDVLMGEDPDYSLQILEGPIQDGTGYIYTVRIQTDDNTKFFPAELMQPGKEFSKVWTTVSSEFNEEFGTQQYNSSFQLESQVSAFAQKFTLTDKALRQQGRISVDFGYTDPMTGKMKKVTKFLPMAEAKMHNELYQSMEAQYTYGERSTYEGNNKRYWKKTGPGIRQILRDGHREVYSGTLTEQRLIDYLMDIFFSRVDEGDRKVTVMTGTMGSIMFHDMLAASSRAFLQIDTHWTTKLSENPRHLSYGAQFTHYQGPEGIEVTLIKNPMYDSTKYCKRMHPDYPGRPIDSWRMTFLDFGSTDGEANIQMLKVKDTYRYGYQSGTVGPMGPVQGGDVNALIAGCTWFTEGTGGVWMKDPTKGGELILDFED